MKKYWSGLISAGMVAATAALGAQGQNPANTPPPDAAAPAGVQRTPTSPSAQTRADTITLTGCLQNAPTVGTSARETAPNSDAAAGKVQDAAATSPRNTTEAQFVLNSATMTADGRATPAPVGTSGAKATTYRLQGDAGMLSPHLNRRVEISGTLQSSSASATGAANAAPGSTAASPTLKVESVKMLAETCAAPTGSTPATSPAPPKLQ
jgi:hypothetical protein